jgi:hypothetical protein
VKTVRWPVVVVVCGVVAAGILVGSYWHRAGEVDSAPALAQLRSPDIDVRIQGVLALEQVAKASPSAQPAVTTELASFVRSVAGSKNCRDYQVGRDVQAALSALSRRTPAGDLGTVIDLHGACLNNAEMANISLVYANLSGVNLGGANLSWSVLDGADLTGANLSGANLSYAHVVDARTTLANLSGANVEGVNLNYSR